MKIITDTTQNGVVVLDDDNAFITATTLANFGQVISQSSSSFDSGFMPQNGSGLLSFRKSGNFVQIAYQVDAGFQTVKWGTYENDDKAEVINLAHPYKVWIADFHKDRLVGLRHFVVPEPVFDLSDPLYHIPLPNTNCSGYNGTSVGWVCLYQTGNTDLITLQSKIQYAYERESGLHEPYNNANMSSTDGPRFYNKNGIVFYATPSSWIEKTEKEGGSHWVLDPNNLIMIRTATNGMSDRHDDKGDVYTLQRALNDKYYPYYPHRLGADQKKFYEQGWASNSSGVSDFSPQVLSKLGSVEPPKELDVQGLIDNIVPSNKKLLDFSLWTPEIKSYLSKKILSFKTSCCICNSNEFHLDADMSTYKVIPFFLSVINHDIAQQSMPHSDYLRPMVRIYNDQLTEVIGSRTLDLYEYDLNQMIFDLAEDYETEEGEINMFAELPKLENDYYVCNICSAPYTSMTLFRGDTKSNNLDIFEADSNTPFVQKRVFNKKGFNLFLQNNPNVAEVYEAYQQAVEMDYLSYQDFSTFVLINNRFSSDRHVVPETYTIDCLNCQHSETIKVTEDRLIVPNEYYTVSNFGKSPSSKLLVAIKIYACGNCSTNLQNVLPKELILSANITPQALYSFEGVSDYVSGYNYFKVSNTLSALFGAEGDLSTHNSSQPNKIVHLYELNNYYYGIVYIEGVPYFVIDTIDNFNELISCEKCNNPVFQGKSCFHCEMSGMIKLSNFGKNNTESE